MDQEPLEALIGSSQDRFGKDDRVAAASSRASFLKTGCLDEKYLFKQGVRTLRAASPPADDRLELLGLCRRERADLVGRVGEQVGGRDWFPRFQSVGQVGGAECGRERVGQGDQPALLERLRVSLRCGHEGRNRRHLPWRSGQKCDRDKRHPDMRRVGGGS